MESFVARHPEVRSGAVVAEIPAPLRWAGMLAGAVITAVSTAAGIWTINTIADVQLTVTRIDERISRNAEMQEVRYQDLGRRVSDIEQKLDIQQANGAAK